MPSLSRSKFYTRYGPALGDRIKVADADLWLRVDDDRQAHGDEPLWGYGKTIRLRQAQSDQAGPSELDTVIVGAVIVDPPLGVVKADIGIKDGRIVGIGACGNPAISDGIDLPIGPHTEPIIAYGLVATPGAVDSHVHLITPELIPAALSAGVTTLITAGFEEPPSVPWTTRPAGEYPIDRGDNALRSLAVAAGQLRAHTTGHGRCGRGRAVRQPAQPPVPAAPADRGRDVRLL